MVVCESFAYILKFAQSSYLASLYRDAFCCFGACYVYCIYRWVLTIGGGNANVCGTIFEVWSIGVPLYLVAIW